MDIVNRSWEQIMELGENLEDTSSTHAARSSSAVLMIQYKSL